MTVEPSFIDAPLFETCPRCRATPGEPCRWGRTPPPGRDYHLSRQDAALHGFWDRTHPDLATRRKAAEAERRRRWQQWVEKNQREQDLKKEIEKDLASIWDDEE